MDPQPLVQRKLDLNDQCIICLEMGLVQEWLKSTRYVALVKHLNSHAVFVYTSKRIPCFNTSDLELEMTLPIDSDLKMNFDVPATEKFATSITDGQDDLGISLSSSQGSLLLEVADNDQSQLFLAELHKSKESCSRSSHSEVFLWLNKYLLTSHSPRTKSEPFNHDLFSVFMPNDNSSSTDLTRSSFPEDGNEKFKESSIELGFEDNFLDLGQEDLQENSNALPSSTQNEPKTTVDVLQKQLGIDQGSKPPVGGQPVTVRETFVQHYLNERQSEFTDVCNLKVLCATWNVNGQSPIESLYPWLATDETPPDIYAIGFQELDLGKEAYLFSESVKEHEWRQHVERFLHPEFKYVKIKLVRLVGIMLIVYIRQDYFTNVHLIDSDSVATGIMGVIGNKGGVSVRFSIHNTSLCFVCSHLAAHQDEFERRNQDYRDIDSKTRFRTFIPPLSISEHDMIFWLGDLNYRINNPNIAQVKELINLQMYGKLLPKDQLIQLLNTSAAFHGYQEGPITFRPTYKYDPGTNNWDSSEKGRSPAWCDRILWKGQGIQQLYYNSQQILRISDHKPVNAFFKIAVRVVDKVRHKKVYEDVMKKLDRLENEYLPQVTLDCIEFTYKDVKFLEPQTNKLTISNVGQVPVQFEFINKFNEPVICKPWMNVEPFKSAILPDETCVVTLEVYVDESSAWKLNSGQNTLDDIMVLHLNGGKDFFITVTGNYIPSCFGSSIQTLVQTREPIRDVPVAKIIDLESPGSLKRFQTNSVGASLLAIPKEIWRLIDHIYMNGMTQTDLFTQPGLHSEILLIRDSLDTGLPQQLPGSIHSVAESLLIFLEAFPDPVIPTSAYSRCIYNCSNFSTCGYIVSELEDCHKILFKYLISFLRELLKHRESNNLDEKLLASLFGKALMRPAVPLKTKAEVTSCHEKQAQFIYLFLTNDYAD